MSTDMLHTAVTSAGSDTPLVFIPAELEDHIIRGTLRQSQIQVLFAWLRVGRRQGGNIPGSARPFRTTQIAAACELTVGAVKDAKSDLVKLGILSERCRLGRPSSIALKLGRALDEPISPPEPSRCIEQSDRSGGGEEETPCAIPSDIEPIVLPSPTTSAEQTSPQPAVRKGTVEGGSDTPPSAEGGGARPPVTATLASKTYISTRATSTSSSKSFKDSKNLVFPSSSESHERVENTRETPTTGFPLDVSRQQDVQAKQARRLYALFCETCPAEVAAPGGRRVPNVGEYLQIRRFLQQGVSKKLIADTIRAYRHSARHFGLIRSLLVTQLEATPKASERRQAEREIDAARIQVAAGSDIQPASPAAYEGRPNADAYRPVDQDLIRRWRALYPDEV